MMFWKDHSPPHIHVEYAGHSAVVAIEHGVIEAGYLPGRQLKLVLAWCELHKDELMQNWELAKDGKPLNPVSPLM